MSHPNQHPRPNPQMMPASQPAPAPGAPRHMPQAVPSQGMPMPQGMPAPQPMPSMAPPPGQPHAHPHPQAQRPMQPPMPQGHPGAMPPPQTMRAPTAPPPVMAAQQEAIQREGGAKALPGISIHAFCDRPETAGAINQTQNDWRMKRTNVSIYMGGLPAAIEFYHKESTPGLILIESGMRGDELFSQLEQLASVCDAGTKVVVIGAANDIRLYRQLMDKGVSDYLVPPLNPVSIIHSLEDLYSDPDTPFAGRVVAFFGAKGGVGSSTLAHNVAWSLAERIGQETALVDMDASWGTTGLDFAYDNSQGLEEALADLERLDEALLDRYMLRHTSKLSILAASGTLGGETISDPEAYEAVVNIVRSVSPLTILDMPHYWAEWTKSVLIASDEVVITATPDLANLRNAKNLIDFLRAKRPNDVDPILVLNRTGACKSNEISVKDFAAAVNLDPAVTIGYDPDTFTEAANDGKMLGEMKTGSAHVAGLEFLAGRLKTGRNQGVPSVSGGAATALNLNSSLSMGKSLLSKLTKGRG